MIRIKKIWPLALLALSVLMGACSKDPQALVAKAYEESRAGRYAQASALFSKALKRPGAHVQEAQLGRARSLAALKQWKDASRSALLAAQGQDGALAAEARSLGLQSLAQSQDKEEARRALELWGPGALADPRVSEAAVALGLAPAGPKAAVAGAPTRADLPEPTEAPTPSPSPEPVLEVAAAAPSPEPSPLPTAQATPVNALTLQVLRVSSVATLDEGSFPTKTLFQDPRLLHKAPSPDKAQWAWRDKDSSGYWLFLADSPDGAGSLQIGAKNAYQISWSPDGSRLLFTAMDWERKERHLVSYDPQAPRSQRLFKAGVDLSPLAAFSPDGSKVYFHYRGDLWVANANGIGRSLLDVVSHLGRELKEPLLYAWRKDGQALAYQEKGQEGYLLIEFTAP